MSKKIIAFDTEQDTLLSALTTDVVKLKKQAAERYSFGAEWFAVDVSVATDYYNVLIGRRDRIGLNQIRFGTTSTHLHSALPELYKALREELLTVAALLDALNNADTEEQIRYRLSKGVRTPRSKERGFRWDIEDDHYGSVETTLIRDDINDFAWMAIMQAPDVVVDKLTATTEKISAFAPNGEKVATLPFDFLPFLGMEILRQENGELTGDYIAELNAAIARAYELDKKDRLFEEHEEARMRGENTVQFV